MKAVFSFLSAGFRPKTVPLWGMGKKKLFDILKDGRNKHVMYMLDFLANRSKQEPLPDGSIVILGVGRDFEFYRGGRLLDRDEDALAALTVLADRVRQRIDERMPE